MNPMKMLKQAQQAQEQMQRELAELRISASSGGDMVTVTMSGTKEVTALKIDPEVVDPEDVDMLQDLIMAAMTACSQKVDGEVQGKLGGLMSGLKLPGMPGFG